MTTINLPSSSGRLEPLSLSASVAPVIDPSTWNRIAYAASHVVSDPRADIDPWLDVAIDWDATLAFRSHLWDLGLGVAEAMDTAQRGTGLDWPTSLELIRRTAAAAKMRFEAALGTVPGDLRFTVEPGKLPRVDPERGVGRRTAGLAAQRTVAKWTSAVKRSKS